MKAILRLMAGLCPDRELSASRCQLSAISYQPSATSRGLITIFKPLDKPKASYHLRPFLLFILVFVSCGAALAQESVVQTTPAAKAETEITPLKIGDKIPDELWEMFFPIVSSASDQVQYLSLGDYKDKLIILDFWATWCAPCISSLHKLDTLQAQFKDDLMVIPTSYEPESKVRSFLSDRKIGLPSLIEETQLKKYFPYRSMPHQVWLKGNEVVAITGTEGANLDNISKGILGEKNQMKMKNEDVDFDPTKPIENTEAIFFTSQFSGRVNVNSAGTHRRSNGLTIYNLDIRNLFQEAYNDIIPFIGRNNRILIDSLLFVNDDRFSYSLFFAKDTDKEIIYSVFQNDLNGFLKSQFGVEGRIEKRFLKSYLLKIKEPEIEIKTQGGDPSYTKDGNKLIIKNRPITTLIQILSAADRLSPYPIIDATNLTDNIDLTIQADLRNFDDVRQELTRHGIYLIEDKVELDVLVISKKL